MQPLKWTEKQKEKRPDATPEMIEELEKAILSSQTEQLMKEITTERRENTVEPKTEKKQN